jgi:hypothetical protein
MRERLLRERSMTKNANVILRVYAVIAALTLIFQIFVRVQQCAHTGGCAISVAKGFAWSVVWPAAWVAYLKGAF